jgi:hypothetical protein
MLILVTEGLWRFSWPVQGTFSCTSFVGTDRMLYASDLIEYEYYHFWIGYDDIWSYIEDYSMDG